MADEKIVTEIVLEGGEQVEQAFDRIGGAAEKAFDNISKGAEQTSQSTAKLEGAISGVVTQFTEGLGRGAANIFKPIGDAINNLTKGSLGALGQGLGQIVGSFSRLGSAVSKSAPQLRAFVNVFRATGDGATTFSGKVQELTGALTGLGPAAGAVGEALTGILAAALAVGAAFVALGKSAADFHKEMALGGERTATTAQEFAALSDIANRTGTSMASLETALASVSRPTKALEETFSELGVSLTNLDGSARDPLDALAEFATKLSQVGSTAERQSILINTFGTRLGRSLGPALAQLAGGVEVATGHLEHFGVVTDDTTKKIGSDFSNATADLGLALQGIALAIGNEVAPVLSVLIKGFAELVNIGRKLVTAFTGPIVTAVSGLVNVFSALGGAVGALIGLIPGLERFATVVSSIDASNLVPGFAGIKSVGVAFDELADRIREFAGTSEEAGNAVSSIAEKAEQTASGAANSFAQLEQSGQRAISVLGEAATNSANAFTRLGDESGSISVLDEEFKKVGPSATKAAGDISRSLSGLNVPSALQPSLNAITSFVETVRSISIPLEQVAADIQTAFDFTGITVNLQAELANIPNLFVDAFGSIHDALTGQDFSQAFSGIPEAASQSMDSTVSVVDQGSGEIRNALSAIPQASSNLWTNLTNGLSSAVGQVVDQLGRIITQLEAVEKAAREAAAAVASVGSTGAAGGGAFARGGGVHGPGTSTSDSIPAWLSRGEWVIRAAAVRKYGHSLFHALNSMRLPKSFLDGLASRFAQGGLVIDPHINLPESPRFASGGLASVPRNVLNLSIGGETFRGLLAPDDVAHNLVRYSISERTRSAGKRPTWATTLGGK